MIYPITLSIPGSPLGQDNPYPMFHQFLAQNKSRAGKGVPQEGFGTEVRHRVLPYTRQDGYDRVLEPMDFSAVVLENDHLKAVVLPELGGRLWSLFDKKNDRDILYTNSAFRPANLAIRDAWFSGGIEWNIGRFGHTPHTCSPVFAGVVPFPGNTQGLRIWEYERQSRLFWRLDLYLPEDSPVLFVHGCIENPENYAKPVYWWTNAAVPETPGVRVLSSTDRVLYLDPRNTQEKTMEAGQLPHLPPLGEQDASYPLNSDYSNEYFFQCNTHARNGRIYPWEAAVYEDGYAYAEASTPVLGYRKMFCWGHSDGGKHWQDYLSVNGDRYLEVQSGIAPTQLHTGTIGPMGCIRWTQGFCSLNLDGPLVHNSGYSGAATLVEKHVADKVSPETLETMHGTFESVQNVKSGQLLCTGSSWGYLEKAISRRSESPFHVPPALDIDPLPEDSQWAQWQNLLQTGSFSGDKIPETPGSFVLGSPWLETLQKAQKKTNDWLTPYHMGVMYFEETKIDKALVSWQESIMRKPTRWAYRNLAIAHWYLNNIGEADALFQQALQLPPRDFPLYREYTTFLIENKRYEQGWQVLSELWDQNPQNISGLLLENAAILAYHQQEYALLHQLLTMEPKHMREGSTVLVDLWLDAQSRGIEPFDRDPPWEIDFRMT